MSSTVLLKMKFVNFLCLAALCVFCCYVCLSSRVLAKDTTFVELKNWWEYTQREKKRLRERWTDKKVEAVVKALKDGRGILGHVEQLGQPHTIPGMTQLGYDLRLINLTRRDLPGVRFTFQLPRGMIYWVPVLQGADLSLSRLEHSVLVGANAEGACFDSANLQGATLDYADMRGATFKKAKMQRASLTFSNLRGANLWRADLREANLAAAQLQRAFLVVADLQDTDLYRARFYSTYLEGVNLGAAKNMRYIDWVDLKKNRYIIGEEIRADSIRSNKAFRIAEITYRDLKTFYRKELVDDVAAEFHFRENEVITKRHLKSWTKPLDYLWGLFRFLFLKLTYGYGSEPIRLLWCSSIVIAFFGLIFTVITRFQLRKSGISLVQSRSGKKEHLALLGRKSLLRKCVYFSLLSFATFGYGAIRPKQWLQLFLLEPVEYKPVRWARIFVGIEAALGIWIFALLVTVLFGK